MDIVIPALIAALLIVGYSLVLIKAPAIVRVVVSLLLIAATIRITASISAARERNEIWNRCARPLGNVFSLGRYYLEINEPIKVDAMLSNLNEGRLLYGTFFGRTNYPDYETIFELAKTNEFAIHRIPRPPRARNTMIADVRSEETE